MKITYYANMVIDGIIRGCLLGISVTIVFYGFKYQVERFKNFIKNRKEKRSNNKSINSKC